MTPADQELVDRAMERADPRYAMSSPALIVELAARLTSLSQANERMAGALRDARVLVEKWCHYQGNTKVLFDQYLGPIDAALSDLSAPPDDYQGQFQDNVAWAIMQALHANVPEADRPQSWSDVNSEQENRIRAAAYAASSETVKFLTWANHTLASPGDSKPVAWRYEWGRFGPGPAEWQTVYSWTEPTNRADIRNITPLYAHPPADKKEKKDPPGAGHQMNYPPYGDDP